MELQAEHDKRRKVYMAASIEQQAAAHHEFYSWLAESIGANVSHLPVSIKRIKQSTDPHFNDISLASWDEQDFRIRRLAFQAGIKSWSLSDTVCVLKAVGRNVKASE